MIGHEDRTIVRCAEWVVSLLPLLLLVPLVGCSLTLGQDAVSVSEEGHGLAYHDDRTIVEVVTTQVGGKNIFLPSTIVLTEGSGRALSFFNTTDAPHGLRIPGLGIEVVLLPQEEQVVELPALEPGNVYAVQCHLHPPHRSATLLVLPAR
jgi:hypothetical protein